MKKPFALCLLCFGILATACFAQPSDDQVKKDVGGNGVIKITLTKKTGTRQWNSDIANWEYVRGVEILRKSQFPGINLLVSGDAVYQWQGGNKYSYWKFRVLSNQYEGLPEPDKKEVLALIASDWSNFYGYLYAKVLNVLEEPDIAPDPKWNWDSPKTLDLRMRAKLETILPNGDAVGVVEQFFTVRLFRDDMKAPWQRFIVLSREEQNILSQKKYSYEEVRAMQNKTLAFTMSEKQAQAAASKLPALKLPDFNSMSEMVKYLHNIMRNGNEGEFRAAMLKLLSPRLFVEGSSTQLSAYGEDVLNKAVETIYRGSLTYRDEYCQNYETTSLTSEKSIYIQSCIQKVVSVISGDRFNVGYVEGKAQTAWRIIEINIAVRKDADAAAFLKSFSNRSSLCPKD